jgi:DNA-binding NtrC family response regulator
VPVLITGPTGIGKSLTAEIVHRHSARHAGPFVSLSCGSLPPTLLESELFGHQRGAFTGADTERVGYVERASGGTLFLDEIGELPLELQVKLLRVVEDQVYVPIGARDERHVDLRIVAATHVDLDDAVAEGRFREDLLYRLRVLEVPMPALVDRRSDLRTLSAYLLSRAAGARELRISDRAMAALEAHDWPGNVRELRNALERAVAVCGGPLILPEHLPDAIRRRAGADAGAQEGRMVAALHEWVERRLEDDVDYATLHGELERHLLQLLLARYGGKPTLLARALDMNRATLRRKLRAGSSAAAQRGDDPAEDPAEDPADDPTDDPAGDKAGDPRHRDP